MDKIIDRLIFFYVGLIATLGTLVYSGYSGGTEKLCNDFAAFFVAAKLSVEGHISLAYQSTSMFHELELFCGKAVMMPWTYPPPFSMLVTLLHPFGYGGSYFLFVLTTLFLYFVTLNILSNSLSDYNIARLACIPAITANLMSGQNGFLIGALVGVFAFFFLKKSSYSGPALGALVIKPHLAIGVSVAMATNGPKKGLIMSFLTAGVLLFVSTAFLGISVWPSFFSSLNEAASFLTTGKYQLFRMTSVYALVFTITRSAEIAWIAQATLAFCCIVLIVKMWKPLFLRESLGFATVLSLGFSPYVYAYDWTIYGVGIALLLPVILNCATFAEKVLLVGFSWFATGYPFFIIFLGPYDSGELSQNSDSILSLGGASYLVIVLIIYLSLKRQQHSVCGD